MKLLRDKVLDLVELKKGKEGEGGGGRGEGRGEGSGLVGMVGRSGAP